jgi:hypothetical protein
MARLWECTSVKRITTNQTITIIYKIARDYTPGYLKPETTKLILTESIIDAATLQLKGESEKLKEYQVLACYGTNGLTEEHRGGDQRVVEHAHLR